MSERTSQIKQGSRVSVGGRGGSFGVARSLGSTQRRRPSKTECGPHSMEVQSTGTLQSSTSHSGSFQSTASRRTEEAMLEKDRDLIKDNVASPIDLECLIQEEQITKILDDALYKTKLVICLPKLVNNLNILNEILSPAHMEDLKFIFEHSSLSNNSLVMSPLDDKRNGDICLKHRVNPKLSHLLCFLSEYTQLRPIVEEMTEKIKEQYIQLRAEDPKYDRDPMTEYLLVFETFRKQIITQMHMTAAEKLSEKFRLRKLQESNSKHLTKIEELEKILETEYEKFESLKSGKQLLIDELMEELHQLNEVAEAKLKKKVLDSDRQMVVLSRAHVVNKPILEEVESETRDGYKTLLDHNIIAEKNQRARRIKVQTRLLGWVQKYDTEMTDKQAKLRDLELKCKEEAAMMKKIKERIEKQNVEYIPLMAEREEEYQMEMLGKLRELQLEHAARVIQNTWIRVLQNRAEKRKLRALWKKKKAEIE